MVREGADSSQSSRGFGNSCREESSSEDSETPLGYAAAFMRWKAAMVNHLALPASSAQHVGTFSFMEALQSTVAYL